MLYNSGDLRQRRGDGSRIVHFAECAIVNAVTVIRQGYPAIALMPECRRKFCIAKARGGGGDTSPGRHMAKRNNFHR